MASVKVSIHANKSVSMRLKPFMTAIANLEHYFSGWETGAITMVEYSNRIPISSDLKKNLETGHSAWLASPNDDQLRKKLDDAIREVECRRLSELFISLQSKVTAY